MRRFIHGGLLASTFVALNFLACVCFLSFAPSGIAGVVSKPCKVGDVNGDGSVSIGDPIYLLNYLFQSGNAPKACATEIDVPCHSVKLPHPSQVLTLTGTAEFTGPYERAEIYTVPDGSVLLLFNGLCSVHYLDAQGHMGYSNDGGFEIDWRGGQSSSPFRGYGGGAPCAELGTALHGGEKVYVKFTDQYGVKMADTAWWIQGLLMGEEESQSAICISPAGKDVYTDVFHHQFESESKEDFVLLEVPADRIFALTHCDYAVEDVPVDHDMLPTISLIELSKDAESIVKLSEGFQTLDGKIAPNRCPPIYFQGGTKVVLRRNGNGWPREDESILAVSVNGLIGGYFIDPPN